jgi:hypothetical protein
MRTALGIVRSLFLLVVGIFIGAEAGYAQSVDFVAPAPHNTILTFNHSSLTLISSGCVRSDSLVTYSVLGSAQQGDSLINVQLVGSPFFQLLLVPQFPSPVGLADSIGIGYTAQHLGIIPSPDTAWLQLSFLLNGHEFDTSIELIGVNPGPAVVANPVVKFVDTASQSLLSSTLSAKALTADAGDTIGISLHFDRDIPISTGVDSMDVVYMYDDDVLTPVSIEATPRWNVVVEQAFAGVVRFRLVPVDGVVTDSAFVSAKEILANVRFRTTLSRSSSSPIILTEFDYYLDTSSSHGATLNSVHGCPVQTITMADSVSVTLAPQCGNASLINQMQAVPVVNILSIYPNPTGSSNQVIEVTFNLTTDTHVLVNVTDATGKQVSTLMNNDLSTGEHSVGLNSNDIPSGTYFIVVTVNGQQEIRKIVVTR